MAKTVYVTGAGGFIGSRLITELEYRPVHIRTCKGLVRHITADELRGVDAVVHLAQLCDREESLLFPDLYYSANVKGTYHLIEACNAANVPRIVYASSAAVYNETKPSPYARTKMNCEYALNKWFYGMAIILRLFNVYGDGSRSVYDKFRRQDELVVHGDGTQIRDFIHVDHVVLRFLEALEYELHHSITEDVGTGRGTSIIDLAKSFGKPFTFDSKADVGVKVSIANNKTARRLHIRRH